jgi:predicted nucleic acid-binding protein
MGCLKRVAFYLGMILGMFTTAAAGAVVLSYLLTGKFPMVAMGQNKPTMTLMTPDEIVVTVREQMGKAMAARAENQEGETHGKA